MIELKLGLVFSFLQFVSQPSSRFVILQPLCSLGPAMASGVTDLLLIDAVNIYGTQSSSTLSQIQLRTNYLRNCF